MIKTQRQTPSYYSNLSRDYQLFGHLFDSVFNSSKSYLDTMEHNSYAKDMDGRLLYLAARTVGFFPRHSYADRDLRRIVGCFREIMRWKGSKKSIEMTLLALMGAQGIPAGDYGVYSDKLKENDYNIRIYIPSSLEDIVLFEDVLDYVLPAGVTYEMVRVAEASHDIANAASKEDKVTVHEDIPDVSLAALPNYVEEDGKISVDNIDKLGNTYGAIGAVDNAIAYAKEDE